MGVIFAGAVQDMVILFFSQRRDGNSLGQMIREEDGAFGGAAALVAVFSIMIILLAVLANHARKRGQPVNCGENLVRDSGCGVSMSSNLRVCVLLLVCADVIRPAPGGC